MDGPNHLVPPTVSARARPLDRSKSVWRRILPSGAFGPRGFLLFLLGLVWIGPAWWDLRFLGAMALWDVMALVFWAWDFEQLPPPGNIELQRMWTAAAAFGTGSSVEIGLRNHGKISITAVMLDDVPTQFRAEPPELELRAAAGEMGTARYAIFPVERGDARLGRVFVKYQSLFRIAERWAEADLSQIVRVYPSLEEARRQTIYLIRSRQVQVEKRLKRQRGQGRDFESLRDYRPGDPLQDICWTASARRSRLVSKIYQVERSQVVWLVLDAGRLLRARVKGPSKLDYAVNAALALAQVALHSGDRVGLLAYGRKPQQQIPAGRGPLHLRALVESLAQVQTEPYEANHVRAAETLLTTQSRRSLIVWLTDLAETPATPEVIESAMQMTPRHLVLFGVIKQPELAELAARSPETAREMYHHVAAQEMLDRRELLLRQLQQQGALAMEFDPAHFTPALVNHYLEIKERSLL
ncbi:MAG TPA: DUF58 domain-containing protein [Candidatus Acidoferrales bacterium]|nr:DUF58 domain-containing protein [Candidatus Acidoferrales bacterium]